jgi:RND family efflux transporter MFP subunit
MRPNVQRIPLLCTFLILSFFVFACQSAAETPTTTPTALFIEASEPVSASGEVVPAQWRQIVFTTNGKIEAILAAEGERVAAGKLLARLDDTALQLAHAQASAALRRAEAVLQDLEAQPSPDGLAAAQAALSNAQANYERLDRSNARDFELEAAQAQIDSAQATLDQLEKGVPEAQIRSAAADVLAALLHQEQARKNLEDAELLAPFDGEVLEIYAAEGEFAAPGAPLLLLANLDDLQVETTDLSELDVARIQTGDPAEVSFDALPDVNVVGKVIEIARQASPGANVTFRVVISLERIPEGLRWGMTAFVTINK